MKVAIENNMLQPKARGRIKKALFYISVIELVLFTSCSTLRYSALKDDQVSLNAGNLELINGCYNRFPNDTCWGDARDLHRLLGLKILEPEYEKEYVRLLVIDETHLRYELIDTGTVVYSKVIKGKLKNGEFELDRRARVWAIFVATVYIDSKVRIGVLTNRNLIIDAKCMDWGLCFFLFPVFPTGDRKYDQEFERIEELN